MTRLTKRDSIVTSVSHSSTTVSETVSKCSGRVLRNTATVIITRLEIAHLPRGQTDQMFLDASASTVPQNSE